MCSQLPHMTRISLTGFSAISSLELGEPAGLCQVLVPSHGLPPSLNNVQDAVEEIQDNYGGIHLLWIFLFSVPASSIIGSSWVSMSEKPMMTLSGVRSSWLMVATNQLGGAGALGFGARVGECLLLRLAFADIAQRRHYFALLIRR